MCEAKKKKQYFCVTGQGLATGLYMDLYTFFTDNYLFTPVHEKAYVCYRRKKNRPSSITGSTVFYWP